jgi:hypothetical protein
LFKRSRTALVASPISQLIWAGGLIVLAVGVIMPLVRRPTPAHEPGYVSAALTE